MTKILIGACALVTTIFVGAVGGRVEGFLFPVARMGEITTTKPPEKRARGYGDTRPGYAIVTLII